MKLVTKENKGDFNQQHLLMLRDIQESAASVGIKFNVEWDETIHDRSISTNAGWKVLLGRGLDHLPEGLGRPVRHGRPTSGVPPGRGFRCDVHPR